MVMQQPMGKGNGHKGISQGYHQIITCQQSLRALSGIWRILVLKRNQIVTTLAILAFLTYNSVLFIRHPSSSVLNSPQRSTGQKRVRLKPFDFVHPLEILESNPFVRRATNPWVYDEDSGNDFSQSVEPVISKSNGCGYNLHQNSSFLETPWFAQDYVRYAACTLQKLGKLQQKSNSHLIRGSVGKYGNLEVETAFEYDLNCPQLCGQSQADAPKVVYLVRSKSRKWRQVIRQTWGWHKNHQAVFFVDDLKEIGHDEPEDFIKISEGSSQSEIQRRLAMANWAFKHCNHARFVALVEETTFVNWRRLEMLVNKEMYTANRIYGEMRFKMSPNHQTTSGSQADHSVTEEEWPWPYFPPFSVSDDLLLSTDVLPRLLLAASVAPPLTEKLPKVYMTGVLPLLLDITTVGVTKFFLPAENVSGNSSLAQVLSASADPHSVTDCKVFFAGFVMGLDSPQLALQAYNMTEGMKARKVTCMPTRRCLAKIDDKCALFAPETKKKNTSTEGP